MANKKVVRHPNLTLKAARASLDAKARLAKANLYLPEQPDNEIPDPPSDLGELFDDDLMELFAEWTAWTNHLAGVFAVAEIDEEATEAYVKQVEAFALVSANPGKGEVMKTRAEQSMSEDVVDAREARLRAYAYRKATEVLYNNAERNAALISRELTRRVGRDGPERRERRMRP